MSYRVMGEVENMVHKLSLNHKTYVVHRKICTDCKRTQPLPAKKCHCRPGHYNDDFQEINCDTEYRVCDILKRMYKADTWPVTQHTRNSASNIHTTICNLSVSAKGHSCDGANQCPLQSTVGELLRRVTEMIDTSPGLNLRDLEPSSSLKK